MMQRLHERFGETLSRLLDKSRRPSEARMESGIAHVWERLQSRTLNGPAHDAPEHIGLCPPRKTPDTTLLVGMSVVIVLTLSGVLFVKALISPDNVYATVDTVRGSVYKMTDGIPRALNVGDRIKAGTPLRTDAGAAAVLTLSDGARIEMQPASELSLEHAQDGVRIRLNDGAVRVTPAKQAAGNLYVQNREVTVPVTASLVATPQQVQLEFEVADVYVSPPRPDGRRIFGMEGGEVRGGRYEIHNATMVDLIRTAYNVEADAVYGGPNWLALDQFNVIAKPPGERTTASSINLMLQFLLVDRFKLVARRDSRPLPAWVLSKGPREPKLKRADGSGESACRVMEKNAGLSCRNTTMDAFVTRLRADPRTRVPFVNSNGIEGAWDFDLYYPVAGGQILITENHPILDAVERQLGLKLELRDIPQAVVVVESVNRAPTANVPEVEKRLPPDPVAFEVASIRPCEFVNPLTTGGDTGARSSPGGQVTTGCQSLQNYVVNAWNLCPPTPAGPPPCRREDVMRAPGWLNSRYFNITAKAPIPLRNMNTDVNFRTMLQNLLVDRFKMATHYEERLRDVYTLGAAQPKLMKADPSSRTGCKSSTAGWGTPTRITCRNVTMEQFAEEISRYGGANPSWRPIVDAGDLPGAWDLTLTFNEFAARLRLPTAEGVAPEPAGAVGLREALEQQLGLKLDRARRLMPVFVIDHIEESPTEN